MNRKQSLIFIFFLVIFLVVFTTLFALWAIDAVKNSPPIEAELNKASSDNNSSGLVPQSQVAGSATAARTATNNLSQQPTPTEPAPSPTNPPDTTSESSPLPDSGATNPQTDTANSGVDSTAPDTKTFTSDTLKISFDYPGDLNISKGINSLTITNGKISWKMKFYDDKKKEDIQTWFKDHYNTSNNPSCTFTDSVIKFDSLVSKLVKADSDTSKCDDGGSFAASSDNSRVVKVEQGKETTDNINKVLTSFKFLD